MCIISANYCMTYGHLICIVGTRDMGAPTDTFTPNLLLYTWPDWAPRLRLAAEMGTTRSTFWSVDDSAKNWHAPRLSAAEWKARQLYFGTSRQLSSSKCG